MIFGILAVLALILLMAAAFRAREEGQGGLSALVSLGPLAFVGWTGALRVIPMGGAQLWFYAIAAVWLIVTCATLAGLVMLAKRSEQRGVYLAAFFLFPVFALYMGAAQVFAWAGG
jgi:hypothetical protein